MANKLSVLEYRKMKETCGITSAIVNITDACNLRCKYCFTAQNGRTSTLDVLKQTVEFLIEEKRRTKHKSPLSIAFFGGEPTLYFQERIVPFIEWMQQKDYIAKHNFNFSITTNGTLLSEEKIRWLKENRIGLLLSIDGDKYTQDDQRPSVGGRSSFDLIMPNIPILLKYFPNTTFRSTVEPRNVKLLAENYLFARQQGFRQYFATPNVSANWEDEEIYEAIRQIGAISRVIYQDLSNVGMCLEWSSFNKGVASWLQTFRLRDNDNDNDNDSGNGSDKRKKKTIFRCGLGTCSMGVCVDGKITGCQEHNTYENENLFFIGSVFTGIDEEKHMRLLNEYLEDDYLSCSQDPNRCDSCSIKHNCTDNFCPSHNYNTSTHSKMNNLASCLWNQGINDIAYNFLQEIQANGNLKIKKYLTTCFGG